MVVALFFANRLYKPKEDATAEQLHKYREELDKVIASIAV